MKKIIKHTLLCLLMLGVLLCAVACGSTNVADDEGDCGDLSWEYKSSDRELIISGDGDMKAFDSADDVPWKGVRAAAKTIVIGEGVTSISDYAFQGFSAVTEDIELPASLTEIGKLSFAFCSSVETITFPEGLYSIGEGAFEGCSALKSVFLHSNLSSLGSRAFAFCYSMTDLEILGPVTIEAETFFNCSALEKIQFHTAITEIDENAFRGTDIAEADIERTESQTAAATVTVTFVDKDGNELHEPEVRENLPYDSSYSITAPEVEGYTAEKKVVSGKVHGLDVNEKIVYTKDSEQTEEVADGEGEAAQEEEEPQNNVATIIAIVIFAVVLIAIAVGAFLLIRADKKNQNRTQTVRKSDADKNNKKGKK